MRGPQSVTDDALSLKRQYGCSNLCQRGGATVPCHAPHQGDAVAKGATKGASGEKRRNC